MSDLKKLVSDGIISAMKAQDKIRLNVLRYLKKLFIENDTSGAPVPEIDIVISYTKKVKDSLALYPAGSDAAKNIEAEIGILSEYLPAQLSEDEVKGLISEIKAKLGSPNMGAVMKELNPLIKGKFDGKAASQLVQASLKS